MQRDLDLARQLLLDIENRGADCSVSVLRSGPEHEAEERVRYHLRLLIDAGLLKEIDRTSAGIPCVRLTHDGHELLELTRSESRWREAKWICQERIDGLSLTVVRGILVRWAASATGRVPRPRRVVATRRTRYEPETYVDPTSYRVEPYRVIDRLEPHELWEDGKERLVRVRADVDEYGDRRARAGIDVDGDGYIDEEFEPALPTHLL